MTGPNQYDLDIYRGDTYIWRVLVWDDDQQTVKSDLTGVTVTAQTRDSPDGTTTAPLTCTIVMPNEIDVSITKAMWTSAPPVQGVWDLQLVYPNSTVKTILAGKVMITPDVTRP